MPEKQKARELCAAINVRGWANTHLSRGKTEEIVINSKTGCRSWKGTKWGLISDDTPNRLDICIDVPRGRLSEEEVVERLQLPVVGEHDTESGIRLEQKSDRDTLHVYLCDNELQETVFRNSPLVELISDIRRWSCL
ncbi:hypothetical protein [Salsuginibacillus kocurii]|uniref:hypothetical protein n=1 Tax=Salsuginibacillus kocurii TaxID=427078 RepID=UPI00037C979E|nr:hypothetical protein [Salsuginibacillus kocurii]